MNLKLNELFSKLDDITPVKNNTNLFELREISLTRNYEQSEIDFLNSYFTMGFDVSLLDKYEVSAAPTALAVNTASAVHTASTACTLFEISFNAFDIFLSAWLSELPVEEEVIRFGKKIIEAARKAQTQDEKRSAAEKITSNRTDEDVRAVLSAAGKTGREIHRMMELLRFTPDKNGVFTAKCEPDHMVIPALGEYFTSRFGETPWSVIDIKRGLCLRICPNETAKTVILSEPIKTGSDNDDEWEELWKHYHKIINNEDRNNPDLQRQLMPQRYWKYLPEK